MGKYCQNCEQEVQPEGRINWLIAVLLLLLGLAPGVFYIFYCVLVKSKTCPQCGDTNFGDPEPDAV